MSAAMTQKLDLDARRQAARRTAAIMAIVAVAVFVGFILHVVLH